MTSIVPLVPVETIGGLREALKDLDNAKCRGQENRRWVRSMQYPQSRLEGVVVGKKLIKALCALELNL